ncbi:MAG: hypothetical protein K0R41_1282, partial [Geminicoccaceae bacterium]|nr:hypothetical protein [Geminicoccaceae bacterium]
MRQRRSGSCAVEPSLSPTRSHRGRPPAKVEGLTLHRLAATGCRTAMQTSPTSCQWRASKAHLRLPGMNLRHWMEWASVDSGRECVSRGGHPLEQGGGTALPAGLGRAKINKLIGEPLASRSGELPGHCRSFTHKVELASARPRGQLQVEGQSARRTELPLGQDGVGDRQGDVQDVRNAVAMCVAFADGPRAATPVPAWAAHGSHPMMA